MIPPIHTLLTKEFLSRIHYIRTGLDTIGTGFSIWFQQKEYLITAKHLMQKELSSVWDGETIQLYQNNQWHNLIATRILKNNNTHLDICAIPLERPISSLPYPANINFGDSFHYGQECYFLGFPDTWNEKNDEHNCFEISGNLSPFPIPFIKKGIISKMTTKNNFVLLYVDSVANKGFSDNHFFSLTQFSERPPIFVFFQNLQSRIL